MKKTLCIWVLIVGQISGMFAQRTLLDSLEQVLASTPMDTVRVNVLHDLAWELKDQNPAQADSCIDKAIHLADSLAFPSGMAKTLKAKGVIAWYLGSIDSARAYFYRGLTYYEALNDKQGIANIVNNLGLAWQATGDYKKSISELERALKIREEIGDEKGIANSCNNLGVIYYMAGNYERALERHTRALKIWESFTDQKNIAYSYINLGSIYTVTEDYQKALDSYNRGLRAHDATNNVRGKSDAYASIGDIKMRLGDFQGALDDHQHALELRQELGDQVGIRESRSSLGNVYYEMGEYDKARIYQKEVMKMSEAAKDKPRMLSAYNHLGDIYNKMDLPGEAVKYYKKTIAIAPEINARPQLQAAYMGMSEAYAAMRDFHLAFEYINLHLQIKDSLFTEDKTKALAELQTVYEVDQKEKEIVLLNKDKEISVARLQGERNKIYALLSGFGLMAVLAVVLYMGYRRKQRDNELIESQNHKLESQNHRLETLNQRENYLVGVVAHDLKNPLSQIKGMVNLINLDADLVHASHRPFVEQIGKSVDRLVEMIHTILDIEAIESGKLNMTIEKNNLADIVEITLKEYKMQAEKKGISIHYKADPAVVEIDKEYTRQIFDNLVSNALKFSPRDRNLYVNLEQNDGKVKAIVKDEGPGLSPEDKKKLFKKFQKLSARPTAGESSSGLGLSIVKKYVEAMNGRIWVESEPNKGAAFIVEFKLAA